MEEDYLVMRVRHQYNVLTALMRFFPSLSPLLHLQLQPHIPSSHLSPSISLMKCFALFSIVATLAGYAYAQLQINTP